jgi:plasmid stabilization system protein ParE
MEQAGHVAGEAVDQAQQLLQQTAQQLNEQGTEQTRRLAGNIRQTAEQLTSMAQAGESGTAQVVVQTAADRARSAADYLEGKQPGDLLGDLQSFGRRRPGAFLLGAAVAGFALGRVAMGAKKAAGADTTDTTDTTGLDVTGTLTTPVAPGIEVVEVDPYPRAATTVTPPGTTGAAW